TSPWNAPVPLRVISVTTPSPPRSYCASYTFCTICCSATESWIGDTISPPQSTAVEDAPSIRICDSAERPPLIPKVLAVWSCALDRLVHEPACDSVVPARAKTKLSGWRVLLGSDWINCCEMVVEV